MSQYLPLTIQPYKKELTIRENAVGAASPRDIEGIYFLLRT